MVKTQILQNQLYKSNLCFRIIDRFLEELKEKIDWFSDALKRCFTTPFRNTSFVH